MSNTLSSWLAYAAIALVRSVADFPGRWRVLRWIAAQERALFLLPPRRLPLPGGRGLLVDAFNNRDMYVQPMRPDKDDLVLRVFEAVLRPGDNVIDVGANIGRMTLLAAHRVGEAGRVIAYEASPMVVTSLYKNLTFNGCANATVRQVAVGDVTATIVFHIPTDTNSGLGSVRDIGAGACRKVEAPMVCLDKEALIPKRLRLIKIDTEGADLKVLRGALETIQRARPIIVLEYSPKWIRQLGDRPEWIDEVLRQDCGYHLYKLCINGLEEIADLPSQQIDMLCSPVKIEHLAWAELRTELAQLRGADSVF